MYTCVCWYWRYVHTCMLTLKVCTHVY